MKTLYISDLDGTLLGSDGLPSDFTASTVNSLTEQGMNFTFATARSVSSAARILPFFKLSLPAVMMNGVFITDTATTEQRYVCRLGRGTAKSVIDAFKRCGHAPIVYTYDGHICAQFSEVKSEYEREFINVRKKLYHSFSRVDSYELGDDVVYINCIDTKEATDRMCAELEKIDGIRFSHYLDTYSKDKYFVEVYSDEAGKGNTVKRLKEMYGFDRVVAFGDNANDLEMLENADLAVAVGNAVPEVKRIADVITDTNDNDGVARFLLEDFKNLSGG